MASGKSPPSDLTALAAEAMNLWQEHLAACATDPKAKAELMKLLEPSRQAFADWTAMMQHGGHASGASTKTTSKGGATAAGPASDDSALRLAQLAHRVAELEKRLDRLESRSTGKTAKAPRAPSRSKSRI